MTPPDDVRHDESTNLDERRAQLQQQPQQQQQQPPLATLNIPKNRSSNSLASPRLTVYGGSAAASSSDISLPRPRASAETARGEDPYDSLSRSPILPPPAETGLHRIRQPAAAGSSRRTSATSLAYSPGTHSPDSSLPPSRNPSFPQLSTAASPILAIGEDLTRFPSESLHSFSFAHRNNDLLYNRQNALKRSLEFMRDKFGWAASSPRIASAQARLNGDEELARMIELLQKASTKGSEGLSISVTGLGIDRGPLTGPAHMANENFFEQSFLTQEDRDRQVQSPAGVVRSTITEEPEESEETRDLTPLATTPPGLDETATVPPPSDLEPLELQRSTSDSGDGVMLQPSQRPPRASLKRTYTDVAGYSLQHRLTEAISQPFHAPRTSSIAETDAANFHPQPPARAGTMASSSERAPHGHRNKQAQAIFMTDAQAPWTITSANDLACLVFGVTRAEVRKLGIMEVIKAERRQWLEDRLRNPDGGTSPRPGVAAAAKSSASGSSPPPRKSSLGSGLTGMGNGITAQLLSKPPSRWSSAARRSKTEGGPQPRSGNAAPASNHNANKSRGVLLCGDVVPIQKMNGATGSASLWVKEKGGGLIWVLEEIAEDVAYLTIDEIGSVLKGSGDIGPIWGLERVRSGMDVQRLIPAFPKLRGTNTGAVDYDAIERLHSFTARTSNSISIPITVEQLSGGSDFRISSFPHIAGIIVLDPATMRITGSNTVFSSALFGYSIPSGIPIADLIPAFDGILRVMTDEDDIALVDGIVIPEQSFRRARALLALREGSGEAAAVFLRPSGVPARHRDGAEIMVDVQMRVVQSDRNAIYHEHVIDEEDDVAPPLVSESELVYALWITYSRQLHAVNHGVGPVTAMISRPATPPQQPRPGSGTRHHLDTVAPSPPPARSVQEEEALRTRLLRDQLEESQTLDEVSSPPISSEPYEHPSPDMVSAGAKVVDRKSIDDFNILEEMGQGAYGQVKLARYKKASAKKMVIKYVTKRRILVDTWHRDRRLGTVPLEIHVLDYLRRDGLQHPNIVEMADFFEDDINYYIEMVPHGLPGMDLFDYIELRVTMEEAECRKIFRQVAEALEHLHVNAKVVHRDIKDENVILDGEGRVKVVDFGSAAYIKSGPFDVFVGTIDYAAPEVLRGLPYRGKEQDVWALGILLYTIVYKENPFYSIDEIMDHDLRVPYVVSEDCIDLIRKMLDRDVERRIGIQAVLEHPWSQIPPEEEEEEEEEAVEAEVVEEK